MAAHGRSSRPTYLAPVEHPLANAYHHHPARPVRRLARRPHRSSCRLRLLPVAAAAVRVPGVKFVPVLADPYALL